VASTWRAASAGLDELPFDDTAVLDREEEAETRDDDDVAAPAGSGAGVRLHPHERSAGKVTQTDARIRRTGPHSPRGAASTMAEESSMRTGPEDGPRSRKP
jgi:hypothetical protein